MSTAYVFGGKLIMLHTACAAQFYFSYYYFFTRKK